jgi:succinate dehydrogenase hydrophobic anchor subunit
MKLLFATLCIIASISGSCISLTAASITQLLTGVVLILIAIIFLLFLIIKDNRQEIDFWKGMKGFIFVIALTSLFTACSGPNKLKCPKDTSWETSRRNNLK